MKATQNYPGFKTPRLHKNKQFNEDKNADYRNLINLDCVHCTTTETKF